MFNPWLLLAIGIAFVTSNVFSYLTGGKHKEEHMIAQQAIVTDAAIKQANENSAIDMQAAYERGQAEAKVRVITRTIQGDANVITIEKPIPVSCRLDDDRMRLISRAVASANNESPPTGVSPVVPKTGKPGVK